MTTKTKFEMAQDTAMQRIVWAAWAFVPAGPIAALAVGNAWLPVLLFGLVAAGLVAYAVHQFVFARYRKIPA